MLCTCYTCGKEFRRNPSQIRGKTFCSCSCAAKTNNRLHPKRSIHPETTTLGDLYKRSRGKRRSQDVLRRMSRESYSGSLCCAICGYDKHVEIHHIKPVAQFSATVTIAEVKADSNLVALCPNHHWEAHSGLLEGLVGFEPT